MQAQKRLPPGAVRDAIVIALQDAPGNQMSVSDLHAAVNKTIGRDVAASSVRSYLRLNTPKSFRRVRRGEYRLS